MEDILIDSARLMPQGQITLPGEIMALLGVQVGDNIAFVRQSGQIVMMNPAVYAMKNLQEAMKGEAEKSGLGSPQDVDRLVDAMRSEAQG